MTSRGLLVIASLVGSLALAGPAPAQDKAAPLGASSLRSEWSVERTRSGRAHLVGYLYNQNLNDAANVWLRAERVAQDGTVTGVYRSRVVGDVLSGNRLAFDVPVAEADATYVLHVEAVDWVKECR